MREDTQTSATTARRERRRASRSAGPPPGAEPVAHSVPTPPRTVPESAPAPTVSFDKPDETSAEEAAQPITRSHSWLIQVARAAAVFLVLALIAGTAVLAWLDHAYRERDAKRQDYIQAARQTVLNLTTIHPDTAKQDVDRILADASGDFKAEFDGRVEPFVGIVEQAKVATDGEVIEAGIESEHGDSTDVLVAARSMVSNGGDAQPEPRDFRLRVTITDEDGHLTTSKVEFVP